MRRVTLPAAGLGMLLLVGPCAVLPALAGGADPMPVTSDTPGYCLGLAQQMEQAGAMPPQIRTLWEHGRDLCLHGHVRGGLLRLRRAIMISRGVAE